MSCVICSIVSVCAMLFCCLAPEMMSVLAGKKYIEAVYCIPPIIIGLQFSFMYSLFANVEFFYEENKYTMYISMAGAAINVVLRAIFVIEYAAAIIKTLIARPITAITALLHSKRIAMYTRIQAIASNV